jgi:hypothetical protein
MNKSLLRWLILFLGLSAGFELIQGTIRLLVGTTIFTFDSFGIWILTVAISNLIGSILLLTYYSHQKYWFVFVSCVAYTLLGFLQAIDLYAIIHLKIFASYEVPLVILSLGAGSVYAGTLIFLRSRNVKRLRQAGVLMFIFEIILLSAVIWTLRSPSSHIRKNLNEVIQWTSLAGCLILILFIMHFTAELKRQEFAAELNRAQKFWRNLVGLSGVILFASTLTIGMLLCSECYSHLYWSGQALQHDKALAAISDPGRFVDGKGEILNYRIVKPVDYDSSKKYPLVISLPYGGQPATDTIRQIEGAVAADLLTSDSNRRNYPAFIFIPCCPPGGGWGGVPNYPSVDSLALAAILSLDTRFSIDPKRRYVVGLSRGGYGVWNFICKQPGMFAAAIPVAGGGDTTLAPRAVTVTVWAFHGAMDRNVPVSNSRNMIKAIKSAGGDPRYTEYPGLGHNIWDNVQSTPGLLDWLFAQHRQ